MKKYIRNNVLPNKALQPTVLPPLRCGNTAAALGRWASPRVACGVNGHHRSHRASCVRPARRLPINIRFYLDPETDEAHIRRHGVQEDEAEDVLRRPLEDRP